MILFIVSPISRNQFTQFPGLDLHFIPLSNLVLVYCSDKQYPLIFASYTFSLFAGFISTLRLRVIGQLSAAVRDLPGFRVDLKRCRQPPVLTQVFRSHNSHTCTAFYLTVIAPGVVRVLLHLTSGLQIS